MAIAGLLWVLFAGSAASADDTVLLDASGTGVGEMLLAVSGSVVRWAALARSRRRARRRTG
jgi:microcompartment protein CcmK/EutM